MSSHRIARYHENRSEDFDIDSLNACLAGLGIGLLAAAGLSLAPTVADIPRTGAEVVRIAFRLGVLVDEVSQNLEPRDPTSSPDTWAVVVPEVNVDDVQHELDAIHAREVSLTRSSVT